MILAFRKPQFRRCMLALMGMACGVIVGCGESKTNPQVAATSIEVLQTEQSNVGQVQKTAATTATAKQRPVLGWKQLPFISESDRILTVIKPAAMAASPAIAELMKAMPLGGMELRIAPADTDWIAVYATPLVNDDNSFDGFATMVIKLNRPASVYEIAESRFTSDRFEEVETVALSYLRAIERTSNDYIAPSIAGADADVAMAVFEYDEQTFVICEEGRLPYILKQTETRNSLQTLVADSTDEFQLLVAADITNDQILKEAVVAGAAEIGKGSLLEILAANANTIVLEANLDAEALLQVFATTAADEDTANIETSIAELQGVAKTFLQQMEIFTTEDTRPLVITGQQLLEQLVVERNEASLCMKLRKPGDLSSFFKSFQTLLGQEVAAIEAN